MAIADQVGRDSKASGLSAVVSAARCGHAMQTHQRYGGMKSDGDTTLSVTPEPTLSLIRRVRSGDALAREQLLRRFLPLLQRWAHGRLPRQLRDLNETDDL